MNRLRRISLLNIVIFISLPLFAQLGSDGRQAGTPFYHVEASRFPAEHQDSSKVIVYLKVPYDDLQFVKYGSVYRARYEVSVVALDMDDIQVDSEIERREVEVNSFEETNSRELNDYMSYTFHLDNAKYKFNVGLMDLDTRKTTYRKITVDLQTFVKGELHLSDLVIVDEILNDQEGSLEFNPNVIDKLTSREKEFYVYYMARGVEGPAGVEGAILTTDGEEMRTMKDTVSLEPIPRGHFISMNAKDLNYSKYVYRLTIKQGDEEVVRKKEFQVGWVGLSGEVTNLDNAIEQMIYVISRKEIKNMKEKPPEEKRKMFMEYWKERDPTPKTEENELMNEYYRRISVATEQFSTSIKEGWRTDRGMVYILFGAPNDIDRHPFDLGSKPYQIWYYFNLNRQFVFVDETGFGDYRLVTPLHDIGRSTFY